MIQTIFMALVVLAIFYDLSGNNIVA